MKGPKRTDSWHYRELFRFLLRLNVVTLAHGMPMKYYASELYVRGGKR